MSQNRPAPAYLEYAAATLTDMRFRMMTPAQRGLCWTMKLELWVNHTLPSNPDSLGRILGLDPAEVRSELPAVMPHFDIKDGWIISPELEDYRAHLSGIRKRQSEGGKEGQKRKRSSNKRPESTAAQGDSDDSSHLKVTCKSPSTNLKVLSPVQTSPIQPQSLEKEIVHSNLSNDEWLSDYQKASKGG